MSTPFFVTTGQPPNVKEVHALAFYDSAGRIHHMHYAIVLEGGRPLSHDAMKAEIISRAAELGNDIRELQVLQVRHPFNISAMHRVDVKKQLLVEVPSPPRATPARGLTRRKRP
jgi:hypothetical protein